MRIYFDACCLNRPFDDQTADRIREETTALEQIWAMLDGESRLWVSSEVIEAELAMNPDRLRREAVTYLASGADIVLRLTHAAVETARELRRARIPSYDSLHLAVALHGGCDFFLTTDDRLIRAAGKLPVLAPIAVRNPVAWLTERYLG